MIIVNYAVIDFLVAKDKILSIVGQPIINESFVDHGDPVHIKEHICLHLMRMNVSMNINYNAFTLLQDEKQLDVTQGAMYKCKLFNKVASTYQVEFLKGFKPPILHYSSSFVLYVFGFELLQY
jgi:hypothetical protein